MKHHATPDFWYLYRRLPRKTQTLADRCYEQLKRDPRYPSLHLKQIGRFWSVRVGIGYRALAIESGSNLIWFWIGSHADYDRLIEQQR
ncbi:MAG: hypothetical protein EAZ61_01920 [Oscillatoriales cyanobacterium]|nr:MAG: hypothetical protein EAZ61_01920 [Oscillatoriales cyanobacterium]